MEVVTTPLGVRRIAPYWVVLLSSALDLFSPVVLLSGILRTFEAWGLVGPDSWLIGIAALSSFGYAFIAHRGNIFSLGQWCLGLARYKYQEVNEYEGKGVLYVLSGMSSYVRVKRLVIVGVGIAFLIFLMNITGSSLDVTADKEGQGGGVMDNAWETRAG